MRSKKKLKIIIFGLGSIGIRHARILRKSFKHEILAFRSKNSARGNALEIPELFSWDEVKRSSPDVAIIANPTAFHIPTAIKCADLGMHLFIEKPLSMNMHGIDSLQRICSRKQLTCYTAYCLRFHPLLNKVKELIRGKEIYHVRAVCSSFLPDWRKGTDHKKNYSAIKKLGGGVVLDLSHEIDYLEYLFGKIKNIKGCYGRASRITVDSEDFADMIVTHENSVTANVHLDYFSRKNERYVKIDLKNGYVLGDLISGYIEHSSGKSVKRVKIYADFDRILSVQMGYFLNNISNTNIINNLYDSKSLLSKILAFRI